MHLMKALKTINTPKNQRKEVIKCYIDLKKETPRVFAE